MAFFLFGKKKKAAKRSTRKKGSKKPPAALLRKCRKLKIKCTRKVGGRRVYRKTSLLKKLISKKMRKGTRRSTRRRSAGFGRRRVSRFGAVGDFSNAGPSSYGYNQSVVQKPGILNQSSQIVTAATNGSRPSGLGLPGEYVPTYGVGRPFFNETVPTQVGPNWNFMGQPDGTAFAVGGPFVGYRAPASFGRRARRFGGGGCGSPYLKRDASGKCVRKSVSAIAGKTLQKTGKYSAKALGGAAQIAGAFLQYGRRARRFGGGGCGSPSLKRDASGKCVRKSGMAILGKTLQKAGKAGVKLADEASKQAQLLYNNRNKYGRRRYNVKGSGCNKLKAKKCRSSPNCTYTKRGCRRRAGTISRKGHRKLVYEGPSLEFGRRRLRGMGFGATEYSSGIIPSQAKIGMADIMLQMRQLNCPTGYKLTTYTTGNDQANYAGCYDGKKNSILTSPTIGPPMSKLLKFGRRTRPRRCKRLAKRACRSDPQCRWSGRRGGKRVKHRCVRRRAIYHGPSLQ